MKSVCPLLCLAFFLLTLLNIIKCDKLISKLTKHGDLDLVLLYDIGLIDDTENSHLNSLENIAELGKNLLVRNNKNITLSYITYDDINVDLKIESSNNDKVDNANKYDKYDKYDKYNYNNDKNIEEFQNKVLGTKLKSSYKNSAHLKALNYVGLKHFYNSNKESIKMVIMFMNTNGDYNMSDIKSSNYHAELNSIHYLFDRKNIILNIITKVAFKNYCHYIQQIGSNTNELLKCVLKNSFYNKSALTYEIQKYYDDISINAICHPWSQWSQCSVTCNMGYHFIKRNSLGYIQNSKSGLYKRKGRSCLEQRNLIIQECFNTSCDHSLDICDHLYMDISILLDDSSYITLESWNKYIIPFLRKFITHFNINHNQINFSLTTYSNHTYNWVDFSNILSKDKDKLLTYLEYFKFNFGSSTKDIKQAIQYMNDHVLNTNYQRNDAKKVMIIINSGEVDNKTVMLLPDILKNVKDTHNIQVYSICINNQNVENCKKLSTHSIEKDGSNYSYSFSNASDLRYNMFGIQKNICRNVVGKVRRKLRSGANMERGGSNGDEDDNKDEEKNSSIVQKEKSESDNKPDEQKEKGNISTSTEHNISVRMNDDIDDIYDDDDVYDDDIITHDNIRTYDDPVSQDNSTFENQNFMGRKKYDSKYTSKLSINSLGNINESNDSHNNYDYYDDDSLNQNKGFLKKNSIILKSLYNLNEDYVNNNINNNDNNSSTSRSGNNNCGNNNCGNNDIPHFKNMRKYNSETNIPSCSKNNKSSNGKLLNRLYNMLFRKKKKYRIKNIDKDSKKKVDKFIQNIKLLNDNNDDNNKIDEKDIEIQFDTLLNGIFDFLQDYDNSSVTTFNDSILDDDCDYFLNARSCGISLSNLPTCDKVNVESEIGGERDDDEDDEDDEGDEDDEDEEGDEDDDDNDDNGDDYDNNDNGDDQSNNNNENVGGDDDDDQSNNNNNNNNNENDDGDDHNDKNNDYISQYNLILKDKSHNDNNYMTNEHEQKMGGDKKENMDILSNEEDNISSKHNNDLQRVKRSLYLPENFIKDNYEKTKDIHISKKEDDNENNNSKVHINSQSKEENKNVVDNTIPCNNKNINEEDNDINNSIKIPHIGIFDKSKINCRNKKASKFDKIKRFNDKINNYNNPLITNLENKNEEIIVPKNNDDEKQKILFPIIKNDNPKETGEKYENNVVYEENNKRDINNNDMHNKDVEKLYKDKNSHHIKNKYDKGNLTENNEVMQRYSKDNDEDDEEYEHWHGHQHDTKYTPVYKYAASFTLAAILFLGLSLYYINNRKGKQIINAKASNDFPVYTNVKEVSCKEQNIETMNEMQWQ
ncbi:TRAP-like protein [Plasmodium sp. gorilla clade G2]|uniref:TRAP-like protein n=1 Tax=Plasmodium sp. gorilla clade G2 TaxID=880535 RepID=UPI000D20140A|nr:TRAP-like protein [Plasmodium sp. gorilla clade G2]SOV12579.1 TRAP-like protein [Plasmodium sp. gorilla clade G2]